MSRLPLRDADAPDAVFHVTARVNWRVFHLEPHWCACTFYRVLRECLVKFGVDILAFVLMSNHFHFVMRSPATPLYRELTTRRRQCRHRRPWPIGHQKRTVRAQFMRYVMQRTSWRIQRDLGLTGHFWEGSYHARRVLDDTDLATTIAYDHVNPAVAFMVKAPEEFSRSSASWWRAGEDSPLPLFERPPPFELTLPELREQVLAYQASKGFGDAMAEFEASGEQLGTWEGLEALKKVLRNRGVGAKCGTECRTPPAQDALAQRLARDAGLT